MATEQKQVVFSKPDWTIEELYRKAWHIVKKNKLLWVFGLAIGGGTSFNHGTNIDANDFKSLQNIFDKPSGNEQALSRVLGDATSASAEVFHYLFSAVPVSFYLLLALEILLFIGISLAISMVTKAWATGALLENIETCVKGGKASIKEASEKSFKYLKDMIWLQTFPLFILLLAGIAGYALLTTILVFDGNTFAAFSGIGLLVFTIAIFIIYYLLSLSLIWGERQIVVDNKPAKQALWDSYKIVKKKSWAMLLLGVINNILAGFAIAIPILVIGAGLVGALFLFPHDSNPVLYAALIPIIMLVGLLIIICVTVINAVTNAFKATVWSLAYDNIKGKYDRK